MRIFEDYEKSIHQDDGKYAVSLASMRYGYGKEIFKSEWFDSYVVYPFADTEIRVPIGYDEYLKSVFGDYMQLPPVEKRISDHKKYYVNLKEGLTLEETKKRIKRGET